MALELMYITNRPDVARLAQESGVDRIWIDMEYIGKEQRQKGLDTVKSYHTIADIKRLRPLITRAALQVRINPIHKNTSDEIENTICAGADYIMLPYFKTSDEVRYFIKEVNGRCKTMLLLETKEAVEHLDKILHLPGIDEVHIGLNDLHLAYGKNFMFELLADGTVENICRKLSGAGVKYGFGGIARLGHGYLPAEYVISEHYRLQSSLAILSRSFCNANNIKDLSMIKQDFENGIKEIRMREKEVSQYTEQEFEINRREVIKRVDKIVEEIKSNEKI